MRESTERRVESLIELSRNLTAQFLTGEQPEDSRLFHATVDVISMLHKFPLYFRVAVAVCVLDANLELFADEVDSGIPSSTP